MIDSYEYTQDEVSQNVIMGKIPSDSNHAEEYVKLYNKDKDDSISLQAGILSAKYYIDHKIYEKAADLLESILPAIVFEEDFRHFFYSLIVESEALIKLDYSSNMFKENIKKVLSD